MPPRSKKVCGKCKGCSGKQKCLNPIETPVPLPSATPAASSQKRPACPSGFIVQETNNDLIYVKDENLTIFVELGGLLKTFWGNAGKGIWATVVKGVVPTTKARFKLPNRSRACAHDLLDVDGLRSLVQCVPVSHEDNDRLTEVWSRLGGQADDAPVSVDAIANPDSLEPLANTFQVDASRILQLRRKHAVSVEERGVLTINGDHPQLFALIDIVMLVVDMNSNDAGEALRNVITDSAFQDKILKCSFGRNGGPPQWAGDIYTAMRVIFRLHGKKARQIAESASVLWVQYWGGNRDIVEGVLQNHEAQEMLAAVDPEHPARLLGDEADAMQGNENASLIQYYQDSVKKLLPYDASKFSAVHHKEKRKSNDIFVDELDDRFDGLASITDCVIVLDDFDQHNKLGTTSVLIERGIPAAQIRVANKDNPRVVEEVNRLGAVGVHKHLRKAMDDEFIQSFFVGAYLDGMSADNDSLQGMIEAVLDQSARRKPFVLGFTMTGRNYTDGGAVPLPVRLIKMWEFMKSHRFEPVDKTLHRACRVYRSSASNNVIATCFFARKGASDIARSAQSYSV